MCKRINIFYPCLLVGYYVLCMAVSLFLAITDIGLPLWLNLMLSQGIILFLAMLYVLINRINIFKSIPYRKLKIGDAILSILIGYMIVPLVLFISNITMLFSTNHVTETTNELTQYPFLLQIFLMAVVPAMIEEFLCRGLFYHSYRKNGILGAAVASGLVFGVLHLNINQFCYAFIMGIIFAFMVEATGSIWSSVLAHFAFNTYSIIMLKISELLLNWADGTGATVEETVTEVVEISPAEMFMSQIIAIVILGVVAIFFTAAAFCLYMAMAKRNGRWEYIKQQYSWGMKPRNGEKFFNLSFIITTVLALGYMVLFEYVL